MDKILNLFNCMSGLLIIIAGLISTFRLPASNKKLLNNIISMVTKNKNENNNFYSFKKKIVNKNTDMIT